MYSLLFDGRLTEDDPDSTNIGISFAPSLKTECVIFRFLSRRSQSIPAICYTFRLKIRVVPHWQCRVHTLM